MILHHLKYAFLCTIKRKATLFWVFLFPIALATFMHMAFGNLFEKGEVFHPIKIAVVENVQDENFMSLIDELSADGDGKTFELVNVKDEKDAKNKLKTEKIEGYYLVDDEIKLVINSNKINQTILETVLTQYDQITKVATDSVEKNINDPQKIEKVMKTLTSQKDYVTNRKTSDGNQDVYTTYFYAVFAMACLFASFAGVENAVNIQADSSALGMRRTLLPGSKAILIISDFIVTLFVQYLFQIIAFIYMKFILVVDFGNKYPAIMLLLFVACGCGIGLGIIIGSLHSLKPASKTGIAVAISMALSVMADLVANGIKDFIEHTCPIINRINPAALIVDSFYALNVYDTYDRFWQNIGTLSIITVVLLLISFLLVRRERYASL